MSYKQQLITDIKDMMAVYEKAAVTRDYANIIADVVGIARRRMPNVTPQSAFPPMVLTQLEIIQLGGPIADRLFQNVLLDSRAFSAQTLQAFEQLPEEQVESLRDLTQVVIAERTAYNLASHEVVELEKMFGHRGGGDMDDVPVVKPQSKLRRIWNFITLK